VPIRTLRLGFEKNPTGSCCFAHRQGFDRMVVTMLLQVAPPHLYSEDGRHRKNISGDSSRSWISGACNEVYCTVLYCEASSAINMVSAGQHITRRNARSSRTPTFAGQTHTALPTHLQMARNPEHSSCCGTLGSWPQRQQSSSLTSTACGR
jgi:hypothetical protein